MIPRYCDGAFDRFVLVRKPRPGSAGPVEVAVRQIAGEIPMPTVAIKMTPPNKGIVNYETWFWAEGYSGEPVSETRDALGHRIEVLATPGYYRWDFGDGTQPIETTSLGRPHPERDGAVTHLFDYHSPGYNVSLTFVFEIQYRVDDGPWIQLEPIERSTSVVYRVDEIRTVVVARR